MFVYNLNQFLIPLNELQIRLPVGWLFAYSDSSKVLSDNGQGLQFPHFHSDQVFSLKAIETERFVGLFATINASVMSDFETFFLIYYCIRSTIMFCLHLHSQYAI